MLRCPHACINTTCDAPRSSRPLHHRRHCITSCMHNTAWTSPCCYVAPCLHQHGMQCLLFIRGSVCTRHHAPPTALTMHPPLHFIRHHAPSPALTRPRVTELKPYCEMKCLASALSVRPLFCGCAPMHRTVPLAHEERRRSCRRCKGGSLFDCCMVQASMLNVCTLLHQQSAPRGKAQV